MRKNLIAIEIVGILLLSCLAITPVIGVSGSGNTLYVGGVGPGNYTKIQYAINASSNGDTVYVYNGTYYENLIVNKSITLVGEDRDITIINGYGSDAVNISVNDVKIIGFTIDNGLSGIRVYSSSNSVIKENIIQHSNYGIYLNNKSKNNVIYHNNFLSNTQNANDSGTNTWNNGYPSGGNYWSDFDEVSEGAYDNNSDGIVDLLYNISGGNNRDRYPLMKPFGENSPVADFTYKVDKFTVTFTSSSYDRDGAIANYTWTFGDGKISFEQNLKHTYAGEYTTYNVTLNVTDNDGRKDTIYKYVTTNDTTSPTIKIVKPVRALYINNNRIRKLFFRIALVIGDITIEVNATDINGSGIQEVKFYGGLLGTKYLGNDTTAPYTFNWTKDRLFRFTHMQIIKVVAYDKAGNSATDRMVVRKIL